MLNCQESNRTDFRERAEDILSFAIALVIVPPLYMTES